jgi:uncharacterized membrane protein YhaH (DUF805 family)
MKNWLLLFLSPVGRVGRRSFLHGWLVLTLANLALVGLVGKLIPAPGGFLAMPLLTLYPTVCLYSKRLHGLGRSGWLQAPSRVVLAVCLGLMLFPNASHDAPWLLIITNVLGLLALGWDAILLGWCTAGRDEIAENPVAVFD